MSIARYYLNDPAAPRPNMPVHYGANAWVVYHGCLLLERRSDCDFWGLPGGGQGKGESPLQAICRELREETGIDLPKDRFRQVKVYDAPGRIASYRDGSVWQMVITLYQVRLTEAPQLKVSRESRQLRFFAPQELAALPTVETHRDIVDEFLSAYSLPSEI